MHVTTYPFEHCVGAMFDMSTTDARNLLPPHLHPLEIQHTRSILTITATRFRGTGVGSYDGVILAVVTPPLVQPGKPLPDAAFYPFMAATSTADARRHAIDQWHLPHYMEDLDFEFEEADGRMTVLIQDRGYPVMRLSLTDHEFVPTVNTYHCFITNGEERLKLNLHIEAPHSQHEEETGELVLYEHPLTEALTLSEVSSCPFREEWYRPGVQRFDDIERF